MSERMLWRCEVCGVETIRPADHSCGRGTTMTLVGEVESDPSADPDVGWWDDCSSVWLTGDPIVAACYRLRYSAAQTIEALAKDRKRLLEEAERAPVHLTVDLDDTEGIPWDRTHWNKEDRTFIVEGDGDE